MTSWLTLDTRIPVKVVTADGREATDSVELFKLLNKIGHDHGVGRVDVSRRPQCYLEPKYRNT